MKEYTLTELTSDLLIIFGFLGMIVGLFSVLLSSFILGGIMEVIGLCFVFSGFMIGAMSS